MIFIPLFIFCVLICLYGYIIFITRSRIFDLENLPSSKFTLVLGAGLEENGLPTDILSDRVETAIKLLTHNKTAFLVLSGSTSPHNFSEPESMSNLAQSLGVDKSKLILDHQGSTTFDSLTNIADYSGNEVITIVTQRFHLPWALWLANSLKINANGIPANIYKFSDYKTAYWYLREIFALPINLLKIIFKLSQNIR